MTVGTFLLLVLAGVGAGLSGSIAGLASLFSYPALLAAGLPPVIANVTNTVALTCSSIGSVTGSGPELAGQGATVKRFALLTGTGGALGAGLVLLTPPGAFERIVPFLVGGASVVLLFQPWFRPVPEPDAGPPRTSAAVLAGIFAVAVYGGYFGAAAGVLMLALILVSLPVSLLQGNALKNVLLGLANGVAAIGFAVFGHVDWLAALPLAIGLLAGARVGPVVSRRIPATLLRVGIALAGIGLAVVLALDAF
jgi:uncharacterized membrane protein YfcA